VVPVEGGTPKLVTEETPSYWHGWHPNNKEIVYVAQRETDGPYNLYKWMVFLSFVEDIETNDHPFYKRVMLRMMPIYMEAKEA
jgi:hypothetical protein